MTTDPGLQPQRTALAWQRTGLTVLAASAATGFAAFRQGAPTLVACALGAGIMLGYLGVRHFPQGLDRQHHQHSIWPTLAGTVLLVTIIALVGAALALTSLLAPGE
ncbi:DUF202 domain-containing protein [Rhodococcus sp. NPDC127530]|uniref:DUF202 domain-containing protein n=1 Tax=unclassified Rhodococcus (in: high G+C Gram-positive bacteria) TaxID=192944 RepID=UPI0036340411